MSFRIELSFLPASDMQKVARDSIRQQKINSAPYGKRAAMMKEMEKCPTCGMMESECDCDECEDENEVKVGMSGGEMPPTSTVTTEDLPRGVKIPKAKMPKKVATKNGKK